MKVWNIHLHIIVVTIEARGFVYSVVEKRWKPRLHVLVKGRNRSGALSTRVLQYEVAAIASISSESWSSIPLEGHDGRRSWPPYPSGVVTVNSFNALISAMYNICSSQTVYYWGGGQSHRKYVSLLSWKLDRESSSSEFC